MQQVSKHKPRFSCNSTVEFTTVDTLIKLTDSAGIPLEEGKGKYYGKKWLEIGLTDENGELHKELLPGKYSFRMEYEGGHQDIKQDVSTDSVVDFQTVDTVIKLTDSSGSGLEGGNIKYYARSG